MFEDAEWNQIIMKLTELTRAEKVTWEIGFDGELGANVKDTLYEIGSVDGDGRAPYYFSIAQGTPARERARLETGDDREVSRSVQYSLSELQRLAFRMASGGPQLAKQLLSQMEEVLPTPPKDDVWATGETPF